MKKLVRNYIPSIAIKNGATVTVNAVTGEDFESALWDKFEEEIEEFIENPNVEEAADILEVLATLLGTSTDMVNHVAELKRTKRGTFSEGYIMSVDEVDEVEVDEVEADEVEADGVEADGAEEVEGLTFEDLIAKLYGVHECTNCGKCGKPVQQVEAEVNPVVYEDDNVVAVEVKNFEDFIANTLPALMGAETETDSPINLDEILDEIISENPELGALIESIQKGM